MSTYKPVLEAGVPRPDDPADVPKALRVMAGVIDQALDAQREDVDRLAHDLHGAGIRAERFANSAGFR